MEKLNHSEAGESATRLNVMIVDDDDAMCELVRDVLTEAGMKTTICKSSDAIRVRLSSDIVDLILLDVMLEGEDGFSVAREIVNDFNVPIVFLTGQTDIVNRVVGLELGADDYITKPFDTRELVARVKANIRQSKKYGLGQGEKFRVAEFQGIRFDPWKRRIWSPTGETTDLTDYESRLLELLVRQLRQTTSRDQIQALFDKRNDLISGRSVDVLVSRIRSKIGDTDRRSIISVRNAGYMFTHDVKWY